jgi:hypothetical protein
MLHALGLREGRGVGTSGGDFSVSSIISFSSFRESGIRESDIVGIRESARFPPFSDGGFTVKSPLINGSRMV